MSLRQFFFSPGNRGVLGFGAAVVAYLEFWAVWFYLKENSLEMALYISAIGVWFGYQAVRIRLSNLAFEDRMREFEDE